ncbi:hypothetical protein ACFE04_006744 [Oxalis oulophora]
MSNKAVTSSSADGYSIPKHAKEIVESIKEIVGEQHTDDDVYSMLQECSMDPNETTQKLLYLDTFREVKSKRDRKKESATLATHGRRRGREAKAVRGNNVSSTQTMIFVGDIRLHMKVILFSPVPITNFKRIFGVLSILLRFGRNAAPRRENGVNHIKAKASAAPKQSKNTAIPPITKTSVAIPNGSSSLAAGSTSPEVLVAQHSPSILSQSFSLVVRNGVKSFPNVPASESGVYSASDPVLVASAQNPDIVGTIEREVGIQQKDSTSIQLNKSVAVCDGVFEFPESEEHAFGTSDFTKKEEEPIESKVDENNLLTEPLESSNVGAIEAPTISVEANCQSVPETMVRDDGQHVIFPNHFQVPEAVKIGFTFGSFEANLGAGINHVNDNGADSITHAVESSLENDETFVQFSTGDQVVSSIVEGDNPDHQQSISSSIENVVSTDDNLPTGQNLKFVESKPEMLMLPEGHQNPPVQSVSNYGFGFMPAIPGNQFLQFEGHATQNGNHQVSSSVSQSPAVPNSTSPQPIIYRQPYPPNYYHYAQYLSPFYMPPIQQFINPNALPPQQSPSGNVYLPPTAGTATPGVKFPVPQFKLGANSAIPPPHMGVPSAYGSYTSPVGFSSVSGMASGTAANNEDFLASQLKENHIYTTGPMFNILHDQSLQSEGSPLWFPAPAQDLTRMQISSSYNLPLQGQHLAYSAQAGHGAYPGIYQTAQSMGAPSNPNSLLQQPQSVPAGPETVARPSSGAFQQQPQLAQMNWKSNF